MLTERLQPRSTAGSLIEQAKGVLAAGAPTSASSTRPPPGCVPSRGTTDFRSSLSSSAPSGRMAPSTPGSSSSPDRGSPARRRPGRPSRSSSLDLVAAPALPARGGGLSPTPPRFTPLGGGWRARGREAVRRRRPGRADAHPARRSAGRAVLEPLWIVVSTTILRLADGPSFTTPAAVTTRCSSPSSGSPRAHLLGAQPSRRSGLAGRSTVPGAIPARLAMFAPKKTDGPALRARPAPHQVLAAEHIVGPARRATPGHPERRRRAQRLPRSATSAVTGASMSRRLVSRSRRRTSRRAGERPGRQSPAHRAAHVAALAAQLTPALHARVATMTLPGLGRQSSAAA